MKLPTISFLYEDEFLFVVEKPALLHSVKLRSAEADQDSLAARLLDWDSRLSRAGVKPEDAGLLQRLDFETSGLMLGAKSSEVWQKLKDIFKSEQVSKSYVVLLEGFFPKRKEIESFIGSRHRASKKVSVTKFPTRSGLKAKTTFELIRKSPANDASLVRAIAASARRHQIRAHAAKLGFPLWGDKLYGSTRALSDIAGLQGFPEQHPPFLLHAETVAFVHPISGKALRFQSELPAYFSSI